MRLNDNGEVSALELWLQRGNTTPDQLGFRGFDVTLTESEAPVEAMVMATDGEVTYAASGSANCAISDLSLVSRNGDAELSLDCELASDQGDTAQASATLTFSGCSVE